jgi:hypothetical protein
MRFPFVSNSVEFEDKSKVIFFDFENNLNFWGHDRGSSWKVVNEVKEENILGECFGLNLKQISSVKILDFCMKKIGINDLKEHKKIKVRQELNIKELK